MKSKGFRAVSILLTFMISVQSLCTGAVLPDITVTTQEQTTEEAAEEAAEASTEEITEATEEATETDAEIPEAEEEIIPQTVEASDLPYRLLVASDDPVIFTSGMIISEYEGVYLIGYTSEEERAAGYTMRILQFSQSTMTIFSRQQT